MHADPLKCPKCGEYDMSPILRTAYDPYYTLKCTKCGGTPFLQMEATEKQKRDTLYDLLESNLTILEA